MCASWCSQPNWFLMPLWEKSCPVYFFCIARIQKKVLTVSELLQFTSSTVLCFLFVCSTDKRCKMFSGDLRLLLVIRQNGSKKETLSNKATEQFNRQCHHSVLVTDKNHTIKTSLVSVGFCWVLWLQQYLILNLYGNCPISSYASCCPSPRASVSVCLCLPFCQWNL